MILLKIQWKKLIVCIAIPLAVGGLSALLTRGSMDDFEAVAKPPLAPPGWLFPVVWTILFVLMGIASYIVLVSDREYKTQAALRVYALQLIFNFFWSLIFFNLKAYLFSFIWLVALWLLILLTTKRFYKISKPAGYLLIPYIIWVTFAGYLNFGIFILN